MEERTRANLESLNMKTRRTSSMEPKVRRGNGYSWTTFDYLQSPFALLIGSLHALPDESFGYKCSKNTTSSRLYL